MSVSGLMVGDDDDNDDDNGNVFFLGDASAHRYCWPLTNRTGNAKS